MDTATVTNTTLDAAALGRGAKKRKKKRVLFETPLSQAVGLVLFGLAMLAVWQIIYSLQLVSRFVLPSPAETAVELWNLTVNLFTGGYVLTAVRVTGTEIVVGFLLAAGAGFLLGLIVGEFVFGQRILMPYLVGLNAMPKIAFAPVFIAWLGFGMEPKILLAAFIAFFPVVVNTAVGIESYSPNSRLLFRSMEASRWQQLWKLKIPTALPYIFAGLKTAAVLTVVGAIVAEFLGGSNEGLGELIRLSASRLRMDTVFALIIILSLIGVALYGVIVWAETKIVHWKTAERFDSRNVQ